MYMPKSAPSTVSEKTDCIPFMESHAWNTHISPQIHFISLEPKTSRTFGIRRATAPNRMHAAVFPNTQISDGITP